MRLEPTVEVLRERYADTYALGFLAAARIGVAVTPNPLALGINSHTFPHLFFLRR